VLRFKEDKLIEEIDGFMENGIKKARFRKTGKIIV
jgi:hypothetical protein